jgi:ribosomal protein L21E
MSAAKWATPAPVRPSNFLVTIERRNRTTGKLETHSFVRRNCPQSIARRAAEYKHGFQRLISIEPLISDREPRIPYPGR